MYINQVTLYGRLGRDPELKVMPNGDFVATFTMATTRNWKTSAGVKSEKTEWHNCVIFGKRAEVLAKYVKKGDKLYVVGRMETRSWDHKEKDIKMYRTEVVVDNFDFGDNPKKENTPDNQRQDDGDPGYGHEEDTETAPTDEAGAGAGLNFDTIGNEGGSDNVDDDDIPF